jgi:hypothetical protein
MNLTRSALGIAVTRMLAPSLEIGLTLPRGRRTRPSDLGSILRAQSCCNRLCGL